MTTKIITFSVNNIGCSTSHESIKNVKIKQSLNQFLHLISMENDFPQAKVKRLTFLQFTLSKVIRILALEKILSEWL